MNRDDRRLVDRLVLVLPLRGDRDREDLLTLLWMDLDDLAAILEVYFEAVLHADVTKAVWSKSQLVEVKWTTYSE